MKNVSLFFKWVGFGSILEQMGSNDEGFNFLHVKMRKFS